MLKKLYLIVGFVFLALVLPAQAQHHGYNRHHHHHHQGRHHNWIAPMILGGVVTYALTRPAVPPPQVVYQDNPPIVLQPGQQLVCGRYYQVFNSITGIYETKRDCWIQ
jgi:hypothetical protein